MKPQTILANIGRTWHHLDRRRKVQLNLVVLLMFIASILEIVSIGAVIPFLGVLAAPERVFQASLLRPLVDFFNIQTPDSLFVPVTLLFCLASVISGVIRYLMVVIQTRVTYAIGADLSILIFERTLNQPYLVHVSRNSSEVVAGISNKTNEFIVNFIYPLAVFVSSSIMLAVVLTPLIILEPTIALSCISAFAFFYGLMSFLSKKSLRNSSAVIAAQYGNVIKLIQEGLGGIRDILLDGTQQTFADNYAIAERSLRTSRATVQIMSGTPRYIIETLGTLFIAGLALYLARGADALDTAIPILGVVSLAAQRLIPVMQQLYSSWVSITSGFSSVNDALDLLEQSIPEAVSPWTQTVAPPFCSNIELVKVCFQYGAGLPLVLHDVNVTIEKGARIGVIGETGSGKSTLLDIIMGLISPVSGELRVDGRSLDANGMRGWQIQIAHVPQEIYLADSSVAENIAFGVPPQYIDHDRVVEAARIAHVHDVVQELPHGYNTTVGERGVWLSGGQRQRIGIARALYKRASVIVLDEATSALDNETERSVMDAIHALPQRITMIIVAHRHTTLKQCTSVIEVKDATVTKLDCLPQNAPH